MIMKQLGAYKCIGGFAPKNGTPYERNAIDIPTATYTYGNNGLGDTSGALVPSSVVVPSGVKNINATAQRACSWAHRVQWTASNTNNRVQLSNTNSGTFGIYQVEFPTAGKLHLTFDGAGAIVISDTYSLNTWYRIITTYSDNGTDSVFNIWLNGSQVVTNVTRTRSTPDFSSMSVSTSTNVPKVANRNDTALSGTDVSHAFFFDKTLTSSEVAIIDARLTQL